MSKSSIITHAYIKTLKIAKGITNTPLKTE